MSVTLYPCMFCVSLLMLFCVLRVCEMFGETIRNVFGCSCYFVVEYYGSVCGGALLDRPCLVFQRMCVCCACDPSERLGAPSICFVCVFVCRKLSSHLGV